MLQAVVRPPGHHATPDSAAGFCLLNNVGIAASHAVTNLGLKRVLILDWDVHHGNGTQEMFYSDPRILYMSLHRYDHGAFYPSSTQANYDKVGSGLGLGFNVNIPWNDDTMGDAEYLLAFTKVVMPIVTEFKPQVILVSAGFDAAAGDPLSGYRCSPALYGKMTGSLVKAAPTVLALEGGYSLAAITESTVECGRAALGRGGDRSGGELGGEPCSSAVETVEAVVSQQAKYWSCLA